MDPNALILEIIQDARGRAAELMALAGVRFAVNQCLANIVPHTGVGGSCFSRDLVSIDVASRLDLTLYLLEKGAPTSRAVSFLSPG